MIPNQLMNEKIRFILVKSKGKEPVELAWTTKNNYSFNDERLLNHLREGGNFGIVGGFDNLVFIDADSQEIIDICEKFPETFVVRSSKPYKQHYYFLTEKPMKTKPIVKDKKNIGHIKGVGGYIVGPNSVHPEGMRYEIIKDKKIAYLPTLKINSSFKDYFSEVEPKIVSVKQNDNEKDSFSVLASRKVSILNIAKDYGFDVKGARSICKFHGGSNPSSLSFDDSKGWFQCFSCGEKGNIVDFIALCKQKGFLREGVRWKRY